MAMVGFIDQRIQKALVELYRKENGGKRVKVKKGFKVKKLYELRKDIFHEGDKPTFGESLSELSSILKDLLRSELGLDHKAFAGKYLEITDS
jgi:hypothetical protein